MIDASLIRSLAQEALPSEDMFVVDVKVSAGNEITVVVDSDTPMNIDDVAALSRKIESGLDRESEDFELSVMSAGIGQPLVMLRQYRKLIGKEVDVVFKNGTKRTAELKDADEGSVTVVFSEKVAVEGKKRKELQEFTERYALEDIKSTVEHISFK